MKKLLVTTAALAVAGMTLVAGEKPTAEHVQWMKDLGAQNGAIRKKVEVAKNAQGMIDTMKHVNAFWAKRHSEAATKSGANIVAGAEAILKANGDEAATMAGMKMVGSGCKGCHDQHRVKLSETENEIK